jgi:hypothetical protein
MKLIFKAFRAIDEPAACQAYIAGHRKVLEDYGVTNITSAIPAWLGNPHVILVTAQDESGNIQGGIRAQIADGVLPLPIETAIGYMDKKVLDTVDYYRRNGGVGELCGLWNSKEVAGRGVSMLLTRASISIINQLKFKTLVGICADYTLPMFSKVGFVVDKTMGNNGEFAYPNPNYVTRVLGILNAETLETADPEEREKMLSLRANPVITRIEEGPKGNVEAVYQLYLPVEIYESVAPNK